MAIIWIDFGGLLIVSLLRGGKASSLIGLPRCSAFDWLLQLCFALLCLLTAFVAARIVLRDSRIKTTTGYTLDKQWTCAPMVKLIGTSVLIGAISSGTGLGGGVVLMPLLLSYELPPSVASATSVYIILYISGSSWIQLWLDGSLHYEYAFYFSIFIFVGTLLGSLLL